MKVKSALLGVLMCLSAALSGCSREETVIVPSDQKFLYGVPQTYAKGDCAYVARKREPLDSYDTYIFTYPVYGFGVKQVTFVEVDNGR